MFHKLTRQKGFTTIEALLIVVILAIIDGTGYFVYQANKNVNATPKSKQSTASNGGKGGNGGPDTGPAKTEVYLIREWGVSSEIPAPPESAALIQYQVAPGKQPEAAQFTTQELIDAGGPDCNADNAPAGIIARGFGGDMFFLSDGTPSGKTVKDELASGDFKPYKQTGGYYYWYVSSQAACGDPSKTAQLQKTAAAQVKQIVTHLQVQAQTE